MKRLLLITLGFLFIIQIAVGQSVEPSKVAVLDASLGEGVHPNASAIVADTINEQFVKSADFIAIDRAYISSIQEEKQFQLSGDVNSNDIKELGITFGAKYICIANVSLLGSTYTVSARLIEVETAQVVIQESARLQGQIDVLFNVAEIVGAKLIGKEIAAATQPAVVEATAPAVKTSPVQPAKSITQAKTFSRTTVSYMIPAFKGSGYDLLLYWLDISPGLLSGYETWTLGLDVHSLITIDKYYYFAVSGSFGFEYMNDWYDNTDYLSFNNLDIRLTAGGIYPIGGVLQVYGGLGIGYQLVMISDETWDTSTFWESESGALVYGIELGGDFRLGNLVFSMRMQTGKSTFSGYTLFDAYDQDFGYTAFMIGAGFTF